jgi:hypothetical protein
VAAAPRRRRRLLAPAAPVDSGSLLLAVLRTLLSIGVTGIPDPGARDEVVLGVVLTNCLMALLFDFIVFQLNAQFLLHLNKLCKCSFLVLDSSHMLIKLT